MKLVVFGLAISSSWGNGHATLWRGLCRALGQRGHRTVFFERDASYYAEHRDMVEIPGCELRLYQSWSDILPEARQHLSDADVGMVTSYCPDGPSARDLVLESPARVRCFYDLDTPVTLLRLQRGDSVDYLPQYGLGGFDLVLSYTGGRALDLLQQMLGARRVAPLYGSVDPDVHKPAEPVPEFHANLSYLGTYAPDRQASLSTLFIEAARMRPGLRFVIGGAQYPQEFPWTSNIYFVRHLPPALHPAFYCSSRATLNVTRRAMAEMGYCPSGRLFEAASCGVPILTDGWEGLEQFYTPTSEVLVCNSTEDVLNALSSGPEVMARMAAAATERTLAQLTATQRVRELENILEDAVHKEGVEQYVGSHSGGGEGQPYSATCVF